MSLHSPKGGLIALLAALILAACEPASTPVKSAAGPTGPVADVDDLFIVECLLPGQVRRLGQMTYVTPRRPIKTSAQDCSIRGGEYVAYDRADYATALKVWLPQAEEGDPQAQTNVGEIYEKGLGTLPDYEAAALWYRRAAEQGYPRACIDLGQLYEKGLGVEQDTVAALNWYRRASGLEKKDLAFAASVEATSRQIADLQSRLAEREREVAELRRRLEATEQRLQERRSAVERAQRRLAETRRALEQGRAPAAPSAADAAKVAELEAQVASLQVESQTREADLQQRLAAAQAEQQRLQQAMAAGREDARTLRGELSSAQSRLADYEAALAEREAALEQSRTAFARDREAIEAELRQATGNQDEVQRLNAQLARREAELKRMEADAQRGQRYRADLEQARAREQALQAQVATGEQDAEALSQRLGAAQSALAAAQDELATQRQRADALAGEAQKARAALASAQAQEGADQAQVQRLSAQLQAREAELAEQEARIQTLESRTQTRGLELAAALEASRAREAALTTQLRNHQEEAEHLTASLDQARAEREQARRDLAAREAALADLRARYQADVARLEREKTEAVALSDAEAALLEEELGKRESELKAARRELERLNEEAQHYREQLADAEAAASTTAELSGPTIEVIDPPLVVTRGLPEVRLRGAVRSRELVGKVDAPAGLLALTVNDRRAEADAGGLFRTEVAMEDHETPVRIAAVDRKGRRASLEFKLVAEAQAAAPPPEPQPAPTRLAGVDFGRYHALIIGNNRYAHFPNLASAVSDARAVDALLRDRYGFDTHLLIDADRYAMVSALNQMREQLTEDDNLLIYYAGHGELERVNLRGYWLPVDAEADSNANWVSNVAITDILNAMTSKHILVVADSCYSGALTRSAVARLPVGMSDEKRRKWLSVMSQVRSRTVLTSGGLAPVLDTGRGQHSVFAQAFLDVLRSNQDVLEGHRLYRDVFEQVRREAQQLGLDQAPEYAPIRYAGHESGEFFFVPRTAIGAAQPSRGAPLLAMRPAP
jgi:hypothetical protein